MSDGGSPIEPTEINALGQVGRAGERLVELERTVAQLRQFVVDSADALARQLAALAAQMADRLDALEKAAERFVEIGQGLSAEVAGEFERGREAADRRFEELERRMAAFLNEVGELVGWTERRVEAVDRRTADRVADAISISAARVDDASERFSERVALFEKGVVSFLRARDRLIEHDRDREFAAILEEALAGLPPRRRRQSLLQLRDALGRRRDRRDAERYRRRTPAEAFAGGDDAETLQALREILAQIPEEPPGPPAQAAIPSPAPAPTAPVRTEDLPPLFDEEPPPRPEEEPPLFAEPASPAEPAPDEAPPPPRAAPRRRAPSRGGTKTTRAPRAPRVKKTPPEDATS